MKADTVMLAAAGIAAYLFRDSLMAQFQKLTGNPAADPAAAATAAQATADNAAAAAATAATAAAQDSGNKAAAESAKAAAIVAAAAQAAADRAIIVSPLTAERGTPATVRGKAPGTTIPQPPTPIKRGPAPAPPLPSGGMIEQIQSAAGTPTLNLDQWSYYYQQVTGATITPAQMGQIIAAAGVDRQTPVGVEAFIAAGKTSGVFPSGLAGLPRLVPVSADLVRAAAYKPQLARLLGDRIYLPAEAWAQLRQKQTGQPSRIRSPGRAITAREFHASQGAA